MIIMGETKLMKKLKLNETNRLILYTIVGITIITVNFFISYKYSIRNIDSDASSELLLGKLLAEEGGICSSNWLYSTELRVLNTQVFYKLFFLLTSNWALVRALAFTAFLILLLAACIGLAKKYALGDGAVIMGLFLLMPFSKQYSQFVLFDQYYFPHILITLTTLLLLVIEAKKEVKIWKQCVIMGLNFLLSVVAGMGGMRQIIILYLPLFVAACIIFVMNWRLKNEWKQSGLVAVQSTVVLFGAVIGYLINSKVLIKYFHFADYSKLQFEAFTMKKLEWFINSYFSFWGYEDSVEILNMQGVLNACGLLLALLFILAVYILIRTWEKCDFKEQIIVSFLLVNIVCHIGIFMFSDIDQKPRYLLPVFFLALPVMAISCRHLQDAFFRRGLFWTITILLGLSSLRGYQEYRTNTQNDAKIELVQFLSENDYDFGYATFWNASVLTEMTNGEIEMYPMQSKDVTPDVWNGLVSSYWLVSQDILNKQTDKPVFVLFTKKEMKKYGAEVHYLNDEDCVFQNDGYYVYAYPSQAALMELIK